MTLTADELSRYTQQLKLKEVGIEGQIKLKNARVLCIGAGGLASPLLLYLAAAGVGTIGIVDDDKIELSNLQRQVLYQTSWIGQSKAVFAKQQLTVLNPQSNVNVYCEKLTLANAEKIIHQYDIVADCSDNFATRYLINDVCFYLHKPYVFASVSQYQAQCAFISQKTACFRCLFPSITTGNTFANCEDGGVLGILPGLMGTIQATEILKWILGIGELLANTLLTVDILNMSFKKYQLAKNPQCKLCVLHEPLELLMHDKSENTQNKNAISVTELRAELQNRNDVFLLDVRTPEEYAQDNLGGILIPLNELADRFSELDRTKPIVIHCHGDTRSQYAMHLLREKGFSDVRFLQGGIVAWRQNERPA